MLRIAPLHYLQDNILITSAHRACLADFGLSAALESQAWLKTSPSTGTGNGTVGYQAPEPLRYEDDETPQCSSRAMDIYSLACLFYEV
jgi:serine/threonine protein kinase